MLYVVLLQEELFLILACYCAIRPITILIKKIHNYKMKNKVILILFLTFLGIAQSFSQSKKEKLKELIESIFSDNLYAKLKIEDINRMKAEKLYEGDTSSPTGVREITDTAILNKSFEDGMKSTDDLFKFMSGGLNEKERQEKAKELQSKTFDSMFTKKEIEKQLSFYKSVSGNKMVYAFHGNLNLVYMVDRYYRDYDYSIKLDITNERKQKIDRLIYLIMPTEFKQYINPYKQHTEDSARDNQNKEETRRYEIILDKMFNDDDLNYLNYYYGSRTVKRINAKNDQLAKAAMKKFHYTPVGYRFDVFKDTPICELAKAVQSEDSYRIKELIEEKHLDLNYQEHKSEYGVTLLHLAVRNDMLKSVKALLKTGAKQDIKDSIGHYPIDDILDIYESHKHRLEILRLLLKYGADPNKVGEAYRNKDTIPYQESLPLAEAVRNLGCTKLLLKHGANMYCQTKPYRLNEFQVKYPVWDGLMEQLEDSPKDWENILVAKYLIVYKHMPIPDPLVYLPDTTTNKLTPRSALDFLNTAKLHSAKSRKARDKIIAYLKKEGFPEHGVVRDGKVIK